MMKRSGKAKPFTLLELLVSMGVFAILMLSLMQFFTSAQSLWSRSNSKSDMFSDARIAMNIFSKAFSSAYYDRDERIENSKLFFKYASNAFAFAALDSENRTVYKSGGTVKEAYSPLRVHFFQFVTEDSVIKLKYACAADRQGNNTASFRGNDWIHSLVGSPSDFSSTASDLTPAVLVDNICHFEVRNNGSDITSSTCTDPGFLSLSFSVLDPDTVKKLRATGETAATAYGKYAANDGSAAADLVANSIQTFQLTLNYNY